MCNSSDGRWAGVGGTGVQMNGLFQEATRRFVATHPPQIYVTTAGAAVVVGALLAVLLLREIARAVFREPGGAGGVLRRLDVLAVPLIVIAVVIVVERFRLLA